MSIGHLARVIEEPKDQPWREDVRFWADMGRGSPVAIATARGFVRRQGRRPSLLELTTDSGLLTVAGNVVQIRASVAALLPLSPALYDVEIAVTDASGGVRQVRWTMNLTSGLGDTDYVLTGYVVPVEAHDSCGGGIDIALGAGGVMGASAAAGLGVYIPGSLQPDGSPVLFQVFDRPARITSIAGLAFRTSHQAQTLPVQRYADGVAYDIGSLVWDAEANVATAQLTPTDFAPGEAFLIPPVANPAPGLGDITVSCS